MKVTYPIIIHDDGEVMESGEKYLLVTIPDLDLDLMTQGTDIDDVLEMAYDISGLTCAYWEDDGHTEPMPAASSIHSVKTESPEDREVPRAEHLCCGIVQDYRKGEIRSLS